MNWFKNVVFLVGFFFQCFAENILENYYDKEFLEFFEHREILHEVKKELWSKMEKDIIDYFEGVSRLQLLLFGSKDNREKNGVSYVWGRTKDIFNGLFNKQFSKKERSFVDQFKEYVLHNDSFFKTNHLPSNEFYEFVYQITGQENIDEEGFLEIAPVCLTIYYRWNLFIFKAYIDKLKTKGLLAVEGNSMYENISKFNSSPKKFVLVSFSELIDIGQAFVRRKFDVKDINKADNKTKAIVGDMIKNFQEILIPLRDIEEIRQVWKNCSILSDFVYTAIVPLFYGGLAYSGETSSFVEKYPLRPIKPQDIIKENRGKWEWFVNAVFIQDNRMAVYL